MKRLNINTVLKVFVMAFLVFMACILYRAVQNGRYIRMNDALIYDKWKEEVNTDIYDWIEKERKK